jgi:hypothetical protein
VANHRSGMWEAVKSVEHRQSHEAEEGVPQSEKVWTGITRQRRTRSKFSSEGQQLWQQRHQCHAGGAWARSSPEAAERGVEDAGLEVGHPAPEHHYRRLTLIASDTVRQFECRFVQLSSGSVRRTPQQRTAREPSRTTQARQMRNVAAKSAAHAPDHQRSHRTPC